MIIRDPVHGDIAVTALEARLLDCPEMQRLRGIRQLGFAHLVYPGCVHTRFDHSLGTMAVAKRIMAALEQAGHHLDPDHRQACALAALLHDITHVPAGHTFEDERQIWPRHDSGPRLDYFLGPETAVGRALADLGHAQAVGDVLRRRGRVVAAWAAEVVSSTVDADLLDYLRRDSFFAGLRQDYDDRVFAYFTLDQGRLCMNMAKHGQDRPDARSEILHLLRMRYFLTERIYTHHTKLAAGAMVAKAVERAVAAGLTEQHLYNCSDEGLLRLLSAFPAHRPDALAAGLVTAVAERRLMKRAYVLTARSLGAQQAQFIERYAGQSTARVALEDDLCARAGLAPGGCIIYCPRASLFKEVAVPVRTAGGVRPLNTLEPSFGGEVGALADQYSRLWRFYVLAAPEHVTAVDRACTAYFGLPSEFVRSR